MEKIFPGELVFLRACDGHDDVHDHYGPPYECFTPTQRYGRGPKSIPLHHVPGETVAPGPLHHEPAVVPVLCACAGKSDV